MQKLEPLVTKHGTIHPRIQYDTKLNESGLIVINHSSPHAFNFDNGAVLDRCDDNTSKLLSMERIEINYTADAMQKEKVENWEYKPKFYDVEVGFRLNKVGYDVVEELHQMWGDGLFDVCIVPRITLDAICDTILDWYAFRTIRMADRITKVSCHDKFCMPDKAHTDVHRLGFAREELQD